MQKPSQPAAILIGLFVSALLLNGCGIVESGPIGVGQLPVPPGCIFPQPEEQYPIDFTLAYTLEFSKDVTPYEGKLSEEKVQEFVSIGEQEVATDYRIPVSGWTTSVNQCSETAVVAEVLSPWSTKMSSGAASAETSDLIHVDKDYKDPTRWAEVDYQWRFHGTIVGSASRFNSHLINLLCRLRVELQSKNHYAGDAGPFRPVKDISPSGSDRFQKGIGRKLFSTYVESMRLEGIKVTRGTEPSRNDGNDVR